MVVVIYYSFCKFELDHNKLFINIKYIFKMSSIYKKGRDGYYYYQAYVYNSDTKKKDKRIFHSLGTKDYHDAEKKKLNLDKIYEGRVSGKTFYKISILFAIVSLIIMHIFNKNEESDIVAGNLVQDNAVKVVDDISQDLNLNDLSDNLFSKPLIDNIDVNKDDNSIKIPKYNIEKIVKLGGAFNQVKIHATIDENVNNASKLMLCSFLSNEFNQFTNIVICLYVNNRLGKAIASGSTENFTVDEKRKTWLAMYTYNPVEGEYFDDRPSGYHGAY